MRSFNRGWVTHQGRFDLDLDIDTGTAATVVAVADLAAETQIELQRHVGYLTFVKEDRAGRDYDRPATIIRRFAFHFRDASRACLSSGLVMVLLLALPPLDGDGKLSGGSLTMVKPSWRMTLVLSASGTSNGTVDARLTHGIPFNKRK